MYNKKTKKHVPKIMKKMQEHWLFKRVPKFIGLRFEKCCDNL